MEILQGIGTSILSTIAEGLVKSTGRHVSYVFRFKTIIEDLKEETEDLRSKLETMQYKVDKAIRDTEEIENNVQKWIKDVGDVVEDVEKMENESREKQTCLNGWCPNWMLKYQLAKKAEKKKNIVLKFKESGKFDNISHRASLPDVNVFSPKDFISFESNQCSFDQIIEALKDDKTNVVGLYGMGGVGKTTLAKAVVNKTKEENIFNKVVMVVISQNPNVRDIQGQIADLLNFKFDEESIEGRATRLFMRLKNEKKILIILDDSWAKLNLTSIGIPVDNHHKDCKIFLTTRRQQVCIDMGCQIRVALNVLNKEEGLLLLKRQVGLNDDFPPTLIQLAKEVADECKGLPLAIVTVGSALKEKTTDEWKTMTQKLKKSKLTDVDITDADVYACLKLSYDYLKNEETKLCFLLCSLVPEDYEIDMEELLRYGVGLGWYQDTDSIEDARTELRVMLNNLKASCLLLDGNEGFVKMHDVVRDVALWITSKGEHVFMVKARLGLTEWPKHEGVEQCTAISLIGNNIEVLPDDLVCPKLVILLLGNLYNRSEICENFFEEMKALKVVTLVRRKLSLKSLQSLTNLVTLQLIDCELRDISSLKKLAKLEILRLQDSVFDEFLEELKELSKLRMLDLRFCHLERIPVDVISRLSRLEQLHIISENSKKQEVEGTSAERNSANLFELSKLDRLTKLSLGITVPQCLPHDFILLKKSVKYDIRVNANISWPWEPFPISRSLTITDIEGTSLLAFKALYENVEYLELKKITRCYQNIVPSIDKTGLLELKRLSLNCVQEVECIIDMTQQHVPSTAFSNLVHLSLYSIDLREICSGGRPPRGFLENLEALGVNLCHRMSCLFPTLLIQRLRKLKKVSIYRCHELQVVFQLEGICCTKENPSLLSSLESLDLSELLDLRYIWRGPTQQVSLQSLTVIRMVACDKLRYVFTLNLAQSLLQLQKLYVRGCSDLEYIIETKAEEKEDNAAARDGNDVVLPKLRILEVGQSGLINFCSENYSLTWPALQELSLWGLSSLVAEFGANLQTVKETLRALEIGRTDKFCKAALAQLKNNFEILEELNISYCREVQVIFQLEQQFSLPNLKKLKLLFLYDLERLYKGPTHLLNLPNLQQLVVDSCERLRHLLSSSLARNLLQLENIHISFCKEMEQVMVEDDREDHAQYPLFPNLSSIHVSLCKKLKALFPVSIARLHLQQLTSLDISFLPKLEEIFGHRDEADMTSDTQLVILLPLLKEMMLYDLKSLVTFCPSGCQLIFPSLSRWTVRGCPKITTRFSVDENGAVHAQAEAPHTDNQHVVDIKCSHSGEVRRTLPRYIGK